MHSLLGSCRRFPLIVALSLTALTFVSTGRTAEQAEPLAEERILRQIRALKNRNAGTEFKERVVRTQGIVSWVSQNTPPEFYIEHKKTGIRVICAEGAGRPVQGDMVEVNGLLKHSEHGFVIRDSTFSVLEKTVLPWAKKVPPSRLRTGEFNATRVEFTGIIRRAALQENGEIEGILASSAVRIPFRLADAKGVTPEQMLGMEVKMQGVSHQMDAPGMVVLLVTYFEQTDVRGGDAALEAVERQIEIARIFQYRKGYVWGRRVHVEGRVTAMSEGEFYLYDGSGGIIVRPDSREGIAVGDWVKVHGFPDFDGHIPVIADAVGKPAADRMRPVQAVRSLPGEILADRRHSSYVCVRGKLLDLLGQGVRGGDFSPVLVLWADDRLFTATLAGLSWPANLPEAGSEVEVTGVARIHLTHDGAPRTLDLLADGPNALKVIRAPGYFNERRLLFLLVVSLGVLLISTATALVLARRHAVITAALQEKNAIEAERNRFARDLHDTLEQMLTAIHLQLSRIKDAELPGTGTRLKVTTALSLVHHCHSEIRRLIWNLRPSSLDRHDLAAAIERMAKLLVTGSAIKVRCSRSALPEKIPREIEQHLLRIAQEALTNTVKHGKASKIEIELCQVDDFLRLKISDDGIGLPENEAVTDGIGMESMVGRAQEIGARIEVVSRRGGGCTVLVEAPLNPRSPSGSEINNAPTDSQGDGFRTVSRA